MVLYSLSERRGYRVVVWLVRPQKSPLCTLDIPYSSLGETTWAQMTFTALSRSYMCGTAMFLKKIQVRNQLYVCYMKSHLKVAATAQLIKHCNKGKFCILLFQPWKSRMSLQPQVELGSKIGQQREKSARQQKEVSKNGSTWRLGGQTGSVKTQRSPLSNSWCCQG